MRGDSAKEEIRRRVDIVALVSRYVALRRSGRRWRGRCPFHQERNPSFYVDPETGLWKCFGCGAAGDVFSFLMRIENLTFPEAVERLGREVGVEWRPSREESGAARIRRAVFRANELAAKFFQEMLWGKAGQAALDYLRGRGLSGEVIEKFGLGYAPADGDALRRYLAARGIGEEIAAQAGLVQRGGRDVFVDRIMFPVWSVSGRIVGFGGRAMNEEEAAKYINTPETVVFRKSEVLYGLNFARDAAVQAGRLVIVEGYMDVIALHEHGMEYAVACLGTALGEGHLELARRYVDEVVLLYDADAAGLKAALRAVETFERSDVEVKIGLLPEGEDPDSLVRGQGLRAVEAVVDAAVAAVEFRVQQTLAGAEGGNLAKAISEAAGVLCGVDSTVRRAELIDRIADWWGRGDAGRTGMMRQALAAEVKRQIGRRIRERRGQPISQRRDQERQAIAATMAEVGTCPIPPGRMRLERSLLAWALSSETLAREIFGELTEEHFGHPAHRRIAEALREQLALGEFRPDELAAAVEGDEEAQAVLAELLLSDEEPPEVEELEMSVDKLKVLQRCGVDILRWEASVDDAAEAVDECGLEAELAKLEQAVKEKLDRGELSAEDPLYRRYLYLRQRVHGTGQSGYYEDEGVRLAMVRARAGRRSGGANEAAEQGGSE